MVGNATVFKIALCELGGGSGVRRKPCFLDCTNLEWTYYHDIWLI